MAQNLRQKTQRRDGRREKMAKIDHLFGLIRVLRGEVNAYKREAATKSTRTAD